MITPKHKGSSLQSPISFLSEIDAGKFVALLYKIKPIATKIDVLATVDNGAMYFNSFIKAVPQMMGKISSIRIWMLTWML